MRARGNLLRRSGSIAPIDVVFRGVVVFVVLVVAGGGRAGAQSAEAEALFNEGDSLMASGKLAQACDAFEASNRIEPRAGTLIRLGECREQNHQLASAWSAYKDALTRVKDPRKRDLASERAAALTPRMSFLTVAVSDEARVDGLALTRNGKPLDALLWNRALPVDGGDFAIEGRAPGYAVWRTTVRVPPEAGKATVDVPKLVLDAVKAPPQQPVAVVTAPPPAESRFTVRRKLAIGLAGVGVVGSVAGAVFGKAAKGKQDDAYALCPDPAMPCTRADDARAMIKAGQRRALGANIAFGAAAAAVISASVLWLTGASDEADSTQISVATDWEPGVAARQTSVVVTGSF